MKATVGHLQDNAPACSAIALLITGFSQSLHLTRPTVELSGDAPKIFMSFAESHCVGGEGGSEGVSGAEGELGSLSQAKGESGGGDGLGLSLRVIADNYVVHPVITWTTCRKQVGGSGSRKPK